MAAIDDFLKKNIKFAYGGLGGLGSLFLLSDLKGILDADNKFKAILKTFKDLVLVRVALVGTFTAITGAVRALVKDTGSLDAALKRLAEVQRYTRIFTPLVGGARAARAHVADLLNFAEKSPFKFEQVAEASASLHGMTRGAYAGTGALKTIGDAAAASGNPLSSAAEAVGQFYETIRNGEPVQGAVRQIRMMGLVSEQSANQLEKLADVGTSGVEMFNALTAALEKSQGGMKSYADDLESVNAAHEKAGESAKAAFGKGFTASEVENTRNYTKALVAVTPALEEVGGAAAKISSGFSTTTSWMAKTAAQTGLLGATLKGLFAIVVAGGVALTAFGASAIPGLIASVGAATAGLGALGGVLTALVAGGAITLAIVAFTAIGVGLYKLAKGSSEAEQEVKKLAAAHREAQAAIDAHAASIENLTDLHEALGKSVQHIIDLQNELVDAQEKGDTGKIKEITRALDEARRKMAALPAGAGLASPERMAVIEEQMQRRLATIESRFQERLRAEPGRGPEIHREHAALLERRAAEGRAGLEARQRVAEAQSPWMLAQAKLEAARASAVRDEERFTGKARVDAAQRRKKIDDQLAIVSQGLNQSAVNLGRETSVGLRAQAQRIQYAVQAESAEAAGQKREASRYRTMAAGETGGATAGVRIQDLLARATEAAQVEKEAPEAAIRAREEKAEAIEAERGRTMTTLQARTERMQAQAQLAGRTRDAQTARDMGAFLSDFDELRRQFPDDVARQMALDRRENALATEAAGQTSGKVIADSMARVGGGGGVAGVTGDPRQRIMERMAKLNETSTDLLREILEAVKKSGTPEAAEEAGAAGEAGAAAALPAGLEPPTAAPEGPPSAAEAPGAGGKAVLPGRLANLPSGAPTIPGIGNIPTKEGMVPTGPEEYAEVHATTTGELGASELEKAYASGRIARPGLTLGSFSEEAQAAGRIITGSKQQQTALYGRDTLGVLKGILKNGDQSNEHLDVIQGKDFGVQ